MTPIAHPFKPTLLESVAERAKANEPIPPPTLTDIDDMVAEFESSEKWLAAAKAMHEISKAGMIALVQAHGSVPAHAEQSKRLLGKRNVATITTGTTTTVHEPAVGDLEKYLHDEGLSDIMPRLFAASTKHSLVESGRTVLASLNISERRHERILSLYGRCFELRPQLPSVKVKLIEPVKPARKPRAVKAAA